MADLQMQFILSGSTSRRKGKLFGLVRLPTGCFLVKTLSQSFSAVYVTSVCDNLSQFPVITLLSVGPFSPPALQLVRRSAEVLLKERWRISDLTNSLTSNRECWLTLSSMGVFTQGPAVSICHPVTSHTCHEVPTVWPWVREIRQTQCLSSLTKAPRALKSQRQ